MSEMFTKDGNTWRNIGFIQSVRMSLPPNPAQFIHAVSDGDTTKMSVVTSRSGQFTKVPAHLRDAYVAGQKKAIPSYDQLTRRQSKEVLKLLAEHFGIAPPQLKWNTRAKRGRYRSMSNCISAGPNAWRGLTNCLLHEFAHGLTHFRSPNASAHGPKFITNLWEVVMVWHDDPNLYAWKEEYKHIAKVSTKMLASWNEKFAQKIEQAEHAAAAEWKP